ncbi:MAG: hypothetical protein R2707_12175 [Acidimicrobiales bacterium]
MFHKIQNRRGIRFRVATLVVMAAFASGCVHLERVTVDENGVEFPFGISVEDVSYDGRYVLLKTSGAIDSRDSGSFDDLYRKDMLTGAIELVSIDDGEVAAIGGYDGAISDDGDRIVFVSMSGRVVMRTVSAGTTMVVGLDDAGNEATSSFHPAISGDGTVIAWSTTYPVIGGASNGVGQVYRRDLSTGIVRLVSEATGGGLANGGSSLPSLSEDGDEVAFLSSASDLVVGDTNGLRDVFVRTAGSVFRASTSATGQQANGESYGPVISGNGHFVAFDSQATNLHPADTSASPDIYRKRDTGAIDLISVDNDGTHLDGPNQLPSISHDGSIVSFQSGDDDLNFYVNAFGLYIRDVENATTTRGSALADGTLSWLSTSLFRGLVSGDGNYAVWNVGPSGATSVPGDTNGQIDVLLRWWSEPQVTTMSPSTLPLGVATTVTITGSGFRQDAATIIATNLANPGVDGIFFSNVEVVDANTIVAEIEVVLGSAAPGDYWVALQHQGTGPGVPSGAVGSCLCFTVVP